MPLRDPTISRQRCWREFATALPDLLASPQPTEPEILAVHDLLMRPLRVPALDAEWEEDFRFRVHLYDRPDAPQRYQEVLDKADASRWTQPDVVSLLKECFSRDVKVSVQRELHGALRVAGYRALPGGGRHPVFMDAQVDFHNDFYYLTPTLELDKQFGALCSRYDEIIARLDPDDRAGILRAETFLHLMGAGVLRPFYYLSRLTFQAHLTTRLNRMGFNSADWVHLPELHPHVKSPMKSALDFLIDEFTLHVIKASGLTLLTPRQLFSMLVRPLRRDAYMRALRDTTMAIIAQGISPDADLRRFYSRGVQIIEIWLNREGLIDGNYYSEAMDQGMGLELRSDLDENPDIVR